MKSVNLVLVTISPEDLARHFHETCIRLAPRFFHGAYDKTAKPWARISTANRCLMISVAEEVINCINNHLVANARRSE